jgi:hypothetical protein
MFINAMLSWGKLELNMMDSIPRLEAGETIKHEGVLVGYLAPTDPPSTVTVEVVQPVPHVSLRVESELLDIELPLQWRDPDVFARLLREVSPTVSVTGLDESVGHLDAATFLDSLSRFNSSSA